jgi:hypothetical protein
MDVWIDRSTDRPNSSKDVTVSGNREYIAGNILISEDLYNGLFQSEVK